MGVYTRRDSPWFWLYLERPDGRGLKERTKITVAAPTAAERKRQRELAEDAYRVRMGQLARGTYELPGARPAITFAAYADWYEAHITTHQAGAVREREILKQLRAAFAGRTLAEITKDLVREWMTTRSQVRVRVVDGHKVKRQIAPATVNRELDLLKSMLREACPTYLAASPIAGLRRLKGKTGDGTATGDDDIRVLSPDEEARLLAVLRDAGDRALVVAAIDTLARLGSLLSLTWRDDKTTHLVFRKSKNSTTYKVPVSTRLRTALEAVRGRDPVHVFGHRRTAGQARDWRTIVGNMLERACARADVPFGRKAGGITFHSFRHTGASRMIAAGVDIRTVQELGGWSDIRLLMRYLHPTTDAKRRAVELVSKREQDGNGKR